MPSRPQIIHAILWLLAPEPSDSGHDGNRPPGGIPSAAKPPLPHWAKGLFWYGITVALYLFIGNRH